MNEFEISPDDPRLTAYALGELEGDDRAAVEAAVRRDPELRAALEEIRATTDHLQAALTAEALEPIEALDLRRGPALAAANEPTATAARGSDPIYVNFGAPADGPRVNGAGAKRRGPPKVLRFPQMYFLVGGLAAACFTVVAVRHPAAPHAVAPGALKSPGVAAVTAPPSTPVPAGDAVTPGPRTAEVVAASVAASETPAAAENVAQESSVSLAGTLTPRTEPVSDGLALLEQTKLVEQAVVTQNLTARDPISYAPLPAPRAPLILNTPLSLTVGLPREAALPLLPPAVGGGSKATPSTSSHAVVRTQDTADALRIAELRATGSEAELARLRAEAKKRAGMDKPAPGTSRPARLMASNVPRSAGLTGEVRVAFQVDATGAVREPRVVSASDPRLAERALEALRTWRFEPALKGGRATAARLESTLTFRAAGDAEVSAPVPVTDK